MKRPTMGRFVRVNEINGLTDSISSKINEWVGLMVRAVGLDFD
jgi:hypothetical protein